MYMIVHNSLAVHYVSHVHVHVHVRVRVHVHVRVRVHVHVRVRVQVSRRTCTVNSTFSGTLSLFGGWPLLRQDPL